MQRSLEDKVRQLRKNKSFAPKIVRRKPLSSEGREGDIALGITGKGIRLYAKLGNKWYTFTSDEQAIAGISETIQASETTEYTISNMNTLRAYNANSTTVEELADILATLIKDLTTLGFLKSKISQ